ncbi:hypothetical protein QCA50_009673 [Cerrena zonata]|uniref:Transcription activator of gluconeogenesis ERT1 n=1 Tax=Cerrena zonata TaxID=2478898 RepID=A0AAW0G6W1_9APHY
MTSLMNHQSDGSTVSAPPLILPAFSGASSSTTAPSTPTSADPNGSKKNSAPKRKRGPNDGTSDSAESNPQPQSRSRDGPKKKKANRACFHCQKAHLTCDDSRPCQRCIKRGMADNCTEGHRKKAKYLLDDDELDALKRSKSGDGSKSSEPPSQPHPQPQPSQAQQPQNTYIAQPESIFATFNNPAAAYAAYNTSNDAANLEYSIISSILGNSPDSGASGSPSTSNAQPHTHAQRGPYAPPQPTGGLVTAAWPGEPIQAQYNSSAGSTNGYGSAPGPSNYASQQQQQQPQQQRTQGLALPGTDGSTYMSPTTNSFPSTQYGQSSDFSQQQQGTQQMASSISQQYPGQVSSSGTIAMPPYARARLMSGTPVSGVAQSDGSNTPTWPSSQNNNGYSAPTSAVTQVDDTSSSIYTSVTKPYDYTEGYHFLMKHLSCRNFEKNDILRVVRALAIFRPSLIALQMPMTEEDEVFVEKCFQRSLLELDKLVSFSGTPTVAWRRTGEICLVGPEFCMLSGWEKEDLTAPGRRKYIYELFENQSVVEYWENFANHAFENTTQSVYSHCILLKPNGTPVPCTFCFSIRRDIMDLPSLVIGQWLPLL